MRTFREEELAGWDAKAGAYDAYAGQVTVQIVPHLLDAAGVGKGVRLLDVASGPGYTAAAAAARGAQVTGVDFAPSMVAEATRRHPGVDFRSGDAEALDFAPATFDAVTCAFGIGHFPEPDKAIGEALRVLRARGRYAFSWWCSNEKHEFFGLVYDTVSALGDMSVPMPAAPPFDRFSEPGECKRALSSAGFVDVRVQEHGLTYEVPSAQHVVDFIQRSAVRTAMLLDRQTPGVRARIEAALVDGAGRFKRGSVFRFAWPALVASGAKR